ncbi:proton-coupled amino acid transporter-like protein CG1139 [Phlebotomus argentipes]|uniref:proton-coupled amino acid transporter-like protein CG1139 n=1 Tax=Phlebotomus argentipes TaxID=94469 RepID=UPI0028933C6A|nr:proton-coupled amino acid transporter-like protein CG1139 [Phlebotomus argentipes]
MSSENYDPHLHREVSNGLSNAAALVHILKGAIGSGILAMPDALKNSGYISGTLGTLAIATLIVYTIHMLMRCRYAICKKLSVPSMSYAEAMKTALVGGPSCLQSFANSSAHIVNIFLIVAQIGACCIYVTFISENLQKVLAQADVDMDIRVYMLIILVPLILINCIPNLKILAPLSLFANLCSAIGISTILYYVYKDGVSFDDRHAISNVSRWPLFFGTVLFALQAIGVIIPVEYKMKHPKDFGGMLGVLNIAMIIVTLLYVFVGFSGYLKYGEYVEGSVTLNLPQNEPLANSIAIMYSISIFISHPLQAYVAIQTLWDDYFKQHFRENSTKFKVAEYVLRISFVILTVLLAIAVPKLALIISFIGAVVLSMLSFVFPAVMDICIMHAEHGSRSNWPLWRNILVIIFGFTGMTTGFYVTIRDIVST